MSNETTFKLTAQGEKLQRELKKARRMEVAIGFQSGKKHKKDDEDSPDICEVATYNELGTPTIPARPFMRDSVEKNKDKIYMFIGNQLRAVINGQTDTATALKRIGNFQKGNIQQIIRNGDFAPNAPSTIRKKKSSHPLIDSGVMRDAVEYVVRERTG